MNNHITTIGAIAEIYDGPHATPEKTESGPYFLSISSLEKGRLDLSKSAYLSEANFKNWTKRVTPKKGDLLFSYETRLGEAALMPDGIRACLGRRMGLLRPKANQVIPEYLLYAYLSPQFQQTIISNTIRGATVDRIALNELPNYVIRIPDIEEQKKIAKLLSSIDTKIEFNNRINAELESIANTLYSYWFLQFNFPDANDKPYKKSGGKMVYNPILKREIPEGWQTQKISNFASIGSGYPFDSTSFKEAGKYKVITIKNVQDGSLETDKTDCVDALPEGIKSFCQLEIGDVLMSLTGNVGRLCLVDQNHLLLNQRVGKLLCEREWKTFFYLYLSRPETKSWLEKISTGSSQKNLSPIDAVNKYFVMPPKKLLDVFNSAVSKNFELIIKNSIEKQQLKTLRDWLLPMLMNGQIKVI